MGHDHSLRTELDGITGSLRDVIGAIGEVAGWLSGEISRGLLLGGMSAEIGTNADGDGQTKLDVMADEAFVRALRRTPTRWFGSEERDGVEELNPQGAYAVAIDPLDGSSNIDANVSVGTIFSIYEATDDANASLMRPGREQVAAGYVIYGQQTLMMLTLGDGVRMFVFDRETKEFIRADAAFTIPEAATEFAINASNYRHWSPAVRAYIDDCIAGTEGPRGKNFNMRWIASLVAETHRIMTRGGVFLYPSDARKGYEHGRLRIVYECAPIALLVEQAGGAATDAVERILDRTPRSLHERTPFVFGSREKVARVAAYHDLPAAEIAPLFGRRGLFTS